MIAMRLSEVAALTGGELYGEDRSFRGLATDMLLNPKVRDAFDLSRESKSTHTRYGDHICGQSMLLSRRLIEAGIPIVERKPLAQVLFKTVEIGESVPVEQYSAVAEVLRYVYQLQGKKLPALDA